MTRGAWLTGTIVAAAFISTAGDVAAQKRAWPGHDFTVAIEDGVDAEAEGFDATRSLLEDEAEAAARLFQDRGFERPRLLPKEGGVPEDEAGTRLPYELWLAPSLAGNTAVS